MAFSEAFKAICRDPRGEAARARIFVRPADAENYVVRSALAAVGDGVWSASTYATLDATEWAESSVGGPLFAIENLTGASTAEYVGQDVGALSGKIVVSCEAQYKSAALVAITMRDTTAAADLTALWQFTAGVPAYLGGAGASGGVTLVAGTATYRLWALIDLDTYGAAGHEFDIRLLPSAGVATAGVGTYMGAVAIEKARIEPGRYVETADAVARNQPGALLELTSFENAVRVNPVSRKRERSFGVIQPQTWQFEITDNSRTLAARDLTDAWIALQAGFPTAGVWETMAQGRIKTADASTDGTITYECEDALMAVLDQKLPRARHFGTAGWASPMRTLTKSSGSADFVAETALVVTGGADCLNETIRLVLVSAIAYEVRYEDGSVDDNGGGFYSITADEAISNSAGDPIVTVPAAGWSVDADAYTAGDTFAFDTAAPIAAALLTPVALIWSLLTGEYRVPVYDVMAGEWYESPFADDAAVLAAAANYDDYEIAGTWEKGTSLMELVQDALKIVHGSMFPTLDGRFGLYTLEPTSASSDELNGDMARGPVDIRSARRRDDREFTFNRVVYRYKTLGTETAAEHEAVDADSPYSEDLAYEVSVGWAVSQLAIESAANKFIARFSRTRQHYTIYSTLAGAVVDMTRAVSIYEPELGMAGVKSDVTTAVFDIEGNTSEVHAYTDPVAYQTYARVGVSTVGGADKVW